MNPAPGPRFRIRDVVATSLDIWRTRFPVVVLLTLAVHWPRVAAAEALDRLWSYPGGLDWALKSSVFGFLDALFAGLSIAPVAYATHEKLEGRNARVGESLREGLLRRLLPVLRVSFILALLNAVAVFVVSVWLMSFTRRIEPESFVPLRRALSFACPLAVHLLLSPLWVAVPAAVVEPREEPLRRSSRLVRGHRLAVCAILVLLHVL